MANYAKALISIICADNADYNPALFRSDLLERVSISDNVGVDFFMNLPCPTGGRTIDLSKYTSIKNIAVVNKDLTNYVTVTWDSATHANSQEVDEGTGMLLPGADTTTNLVITANVATCNCDIVIIHG